MNILVTGAAGFIGSALAKRLAGEGHAVIGIDNFNPYYDVNLKRARVAALLPDLTIEEVDITDKTALEDLFKRNSFDVVCHLAAQAGVRYSTEAPEVYVNTNVLGTEILLETMQRHGVGQLVFASTSSAYGNDTQVPFREDAAADRPVSVYAATKRAAELLAYTYHVQYGIQVTCLRFFTVYGPWSRPDMAMLSFTENILSGKTIDVYNDGKLRRDFTYIDDIVEGFTRAVEVPLSYEIVNLGNGKPVELLEFIETLEAELGVRAEKRFLPMQKGDVYETYADTRKAKELLGFEAKTPFREGLKHFTDWYREYQSGKSE